MFEGLNTCRPLRRMRYFVAIARALAPTKTHQPRTLHQSPGSVPGTLRMSAMPLPVSNALAGQAITFSRLNATASSIRPQVAIESRIWAIETLKSNTV